MKLHIMSNIQVSDSATDITETILHFIDIYVQEHPQDYSQPKFINIIFDNVYDLLQLTVGSATNFTHAYLVEMIYENISYYFKTLGIPRSYNSSIIINTHDPQYAECTTYCIERYSTVTSKITRVA